MPYNKTLDLEMPDKERAIHADAQDITHDARTEELRVIELQKSIDDLISEIRAMLPQSIANEVIGNLPAERSGHGASAHNLLRAREDAKYRLAYSLSIHTLEAAANMMQSFDDAQEAEYKKIREALANTKHAAILDNAERILSANNVAELSAEDKVDLLLAGAGKDRVNDPEFDNDMTLNYVESPEGQRALQGALDNPDAKVIIAQRNADIHQLTQDSVDPSIPEPKRNAARAQAGLGLVLKDPEPKTVQEVKDALTIAAEPYVRSFLDPKSKVMPADVGAHIKTPADAMAALRMAVDIYAEPSGTRRAAAIKDMNDGNGTISKDTAAFKFSVTVTAALALDEVANARLKGRKLEPQQIIDHMREQVPELAKAPDALLASLAADAIKTYKPDMNIAQGAQAMAKRAVDAAVEVDKQSKALAAAATANGDPLVSAAERNRLRKEEGISVLEQEFGDVASILHKAGVAKTSDGKVLTAFGMIQLLEDTGVITDNGQKTNRVKDKFLENVWEFQQFNTWNDDNINRLNTDGGERGKQQLTGLEALNAIRLAEAIRDNKNFKSLIDSDKNNSLSDAEVQNGLKLVAELNKQLAQTTYYNGKIDVNKDGKIDSKEAVAALVAAGVSNPSSIDKVDELNRMFDQAASRVSNVTVVR